jgi:hypothetical protein
VCGDAREDRRRWAGLGFDRVGTGVCRGPADDQLQKLENLVNASWQVKMGYWVGMLDTKLG